MTVRTCEMLFAGKPPLFASCSVLRDLGPEIQWVHSYVTDDTPPRGALLVAEENGQIAGCVALRELRNGACEMKRMFVAPEFHGRGVGQALARTVIERAKDLGYCKMMLDTGPAQREAQGLYRKIGFEDVEPYYDLSPELRDWLVFMELDLAR